MTVAVPQKSLVVPQNPNLLQQTFRGHFCLVDHCAPQPGSHSDFWSQDDVQFAPPQKSGPSPQTPYLLQQPILHGLLAEQEYGSLGGCCDACADTNEIKQMQIAVMAIRNRGYIMIDRYREKDRDLKERELRIRERKVVATTMVRLRTVRLKGGGEQSRKK